MSLLGGLLLLGWGLGSMFLGLGRGAGRRAYGAWRLIVPDRSPAPSHLRFPFCSSGSLVGCLWYHP